MFPQVPGFEAAPINRLDDSTQQRPELLDHAFEFRIQWVSQQIIVNISYQMYKTLLLLALERIVRRVEIGDQHA